MSTFSIYNLIILNSEEQKNLTLLYQPLIGIQALSLYYTLYFLSFDQRQTLVNYLYPLLFDILNINENIFQQHQEKLEIFNLVSTFRNKEEKVIYGLHKPLNADVFFQDPLFSNALLSEIGEENYFFLQKKCLMTLGEMNFPCYQNISKKFTDVYRFQKNHLSIAPIKKEISGLHNTDHNSHHHALQVYFHYEEFLNALSERFRKPFLLEWSNIDFITKLGFVYGLKPTELAVLYQETFRNNYDQSVDLNVLKINLKKKILKKNYNIKLINVERFDNEEEEIIFYLKNTASRHIIEKFIKNKFVVYELCVIVEQLFKQFEIEPGVINALFMYVCKKKALDLDKIPKYRFNYFKTILTEWIRKGILTTEIAYDFIIEEQNFKITNASKRKNNPKWLDDFKKSLKSQDVEGD